MAVTAIALPGASYSAQWWRQAMVGGTFAHTTHPVAAMPGVVAGLEVSGTGKAQVTVAAGTCVVTPSDTTRGSYLVSSDVPAAVALTPADSVYSRRDRIVVRIRDTTFGDATTSATIEAVTGVASVSPTNPPIPDGCLHLADITVSPSSDSAPAVATDYRTWTSAIGGAMAGTRTVRQSLGQAHLRPGQTFTETNDSPGASPPGRKGQTWRWNGAAWLPQYMTGTYCYVGVTQRPFNWDYTTDIQTARLTALRLGLASGAAFDERNDMPTVITNGYNWVAPYAGRYRLRAMVAINPNQGAGYTLGIYKNLNATQADQGAVGAAKPAGVVLLAENKGYAGGIPADQMSLETEVGQFALNQGDSITVTIWQISGATKKIYWENPFACYLEVTRLGD